MPEIANGNLGPELAYDLSFSAGALNITLKYVGAEANLSLTGTIGAAALIEALALKISNPTEKSLLQGLEAIIKAIP